MLTNPSQQTYHAPLQQRQNCMADHIAGIHNVPTNVHCLSNDAKYPRADECALDNYVPTSPSICGQLGGRRSNCKDQCVT